MTIRLLRIAVAQYPVSAIDSWEAWVDKVSRWVAEAAWAGARLLVFPEYGAMELGSLRPPAADPRAEAAALQPDLERFRELFRALARRHDVHILAPSFPVAHGEGFRNLAHLMTPDGSVAWQDKLITTPFERERLGVVGGAAVRVFDTALGRIGVAICYDAEFPLIARRQAEAGAELILCPSCTDTMAGYHRVRVAAQARALENQCFVVQAPTVGQAPWSATVADNHGAAAVFAPPDIGFPDDGVVAMGALDEAQWLYAEVDFDALAAVRRDGRVRNHAHWPEQSGLAAAEVFSLR